MQPIVTSLRIQNTLATVESEIDLSLSMSGFISRHMIKNLKCDVTHVFTPFLCHTFLDPSLSSVTYFLDSPHIPLTACLPDFLDQDPLLINNIGLELLLWGCRI